MKEAPVVSPASMPTSVLSSKGLMGAVPSFELPFSASIASPCSTSDDESISSGAPSELQSLSRKIDRLLSFENLNAHSETMQACALSLRTRVPLFLRRTDPFSPETPSPFRSALALLRASEYVDRIQEGMDGVSNESLDMQLRTVLSGLDVESLPSHFRKNLSFRVSPWVHGFDLPVGPTASTELTATWNQCPLFVEVEPIVEFRTDDVTSVDYARRAAMACKVTILKCRHIASNVRAGLGVIGEATISVHVTPVGRCLMDDKGRAQSLQVKEARVCQLNAFPAKPAANIDLFTSHVHGESGITVMVPIKTCQTRHVMEVPILHIELCMAPPQVI